MSKLKLTWLAIKGFFLPGTSAFEQIVDYVLGQLNNLLAAENVGDRVKEVVAVAQKVHSTLVHYIDWCPVPWLKYYNAILDATGSVICAFGDGQLTADEIKTVTANFQTAYATWIAD